MSLVSSRSRVQISMVAGGEEVAIAQLGERSTEDAEVGCSIHPDGKSRGRARAVNGVD